MKKLLLPLNEDSPFFQNLLTRGQREPQERLAPYSLQKIPIIALVKGFRMVTPIHLRPRTIVH